MSNKIIKAKVIEKQIKIKEKNTAILEYFAVIKSEYDIERNKKVSFENRAGIFFALIGTLCVYLFDKIKVSEIFSLINEQLTTIILIKILSGCAVYISLAFTLYCLIKTITVRQHNNFEVKNIDESLLIENKIDAMARIIFTYRDIILQHRAINEKRAKKFKNSLYGVVVMLVAIVLYISI